MSKRLALVLVSAFLVFIGSVAKSAERTEVRGQVLDVTGKPVADVVVSTLWITEEGGWVTRRGARTDAEGNFVTKEFLPSSGACVLLAFDESRERGTLARLDAETVQEPLTLTLQPTTLVQAAFSCTELGHEIEETYMRFRAWWARKYFALHKGASSISLRLPPGDYAFTVGGVDCMRVTKRVKLTQHMRIVDLGTTDLEPTIIARHYGKAPPAWHVTDARGVAPETTLADYKGKWVLLEFWGYW